MFIILNKVFVGSFISMRKTSLLLLNKYAYQEQQPRMLEYSYQIGKHVFSKLQHLCIYLISVRLILIPPKEHIETKIILSTKVTVQRFRLCSLKFVRVITGLTYSEATTFSATFSKWVRGFHVFPDIELPYQLKQTRSEI